MWIKVAAFAIALGAFLLLVYAAIKQLRGNANLIGAGEVTPGALIDFDRWLHGSVKYFRGQGFFPDLGGASDVEAAKHVRLRMEAQHANIKELLGPGKAPPDLWLLSCDSSRVWWKDMEADVGPGNDVYVGTLQEWAAISRGAFDPKDIREIWDCDIRENDDGTSEIRKVRGINISFTLRGMKHVIRPEYLDDYIDQGILVAINDLIASTGYQFEPYEALGQDSFIIVLSAREKKRLKRERGWKFLL